jgi:NTE family protein
VTIEKDELKIGISLSGGGVRASVFHLGVLARLAVDQLLEKITFVSTVSGGSLATGLVYTLSNNQWPTSRFYLENCLPEAKLLITSKRLQSYWISQNIFTLGIPFSNRGKLLARSLQSEWGIRANLDDIPLQPRWIINATTFETGKNWRFIPQKRMGDYLSGYVESPDIPLATALAASSGVPLLIGPTTIKTSRYRWFVYDEITGRKAPFNPNFRKYHLWDGGVYENLGLEALFKPRSQKFRNEYNFLIVSDASAVLELKKYTPFTKRLIDIATDQTRGLRSRMVVSYFEREKGKGVYLRIGNAGEKLLRDVGFPSDQAKQALGNSQSATETSALARFPTTLRKLSVEEFVQILQHGWEVANFTFLGRRPSAFSHKSFRDDCPTLRKDFNTS